MYILLISTWFPSDNNPTYGNFVFEQAELLKKNGHRVEVLQPILSGSAKQTWSQKKQKKQSKIYQGIPVHFIPVSVWVPRIKEFYFRLLYTRCKKALKKHFEANGKPDFFHSHAAFMGGVIAAKLSQTFDIPLMHTEHTSGLIFNPRQYTEIDVHWLKNLYAQAKKNLFVSQFAIDATEEKMGIEIPNACVLPNLVHESFFEEKPRHKIYTALCLGNLTAMKNQPFLLDVWTRVLNVFPEARLVLAGEGFSNLKFQQKISALGLSNNVKILPRLNRTEIKTMMAESNMVLSASRVETFGLTLAEALAMGVPVVATDSGGPRDIVFPGDGFLVPQDDVDAFAQAVLKIIEGNHAAPEEISRNTQSRFGGKEIYRRLMDEYQKALI